MTDSLLIALHAYRTTPGRRPTEDFVTEAWAWFLRNERGLLEAFEAAIRGVIEQGEAPLGRTSLTPPLTPQSFSGADVATQRSFGGGRLDMVIMGDARALVFEHKAWSGLGDGQIANYRAWAAAEWPNDHAVIFVTRERREWIGASAGAANTPHIELTWGFIEGVCLEWAASAGDRRMVDDFVALLRAEGLGRPLPLTQDALAGWFPAQRVVPVLQRLWHSLGTHECWRDVYARIAPGVSDAAPILRWSRGSQPRDGRFGLDMLPTWRPGFFFGVMLDPTDHKLDVSDETLGPDLCLIVSYDWQTPTPPSLREFTGSDEVVALRGRLAAGASPWSFVDQVDRPAAQQNKWHPFTLRRPLAEVVRGANTFEAQRDAVLAEGHAMFELLLQRGELEKWMARNPIAGGEPRHEL